MTELDYQISKSRKVNLGQKDSIRTWDPYVTITLADKSIYKYRGLVDFADPQVDSKSGTFSVHADIPNPDRELLPGTTVYLQRKKSQAARDIRMHVAEDGDSLREISQRYGVRLKSVLKMNGMTENTVLREGDVVKLRRK